MSHEPDRRDDSPDDAELEPDSSEASTIDFEPRPRAEAIAAAEAARASGVRPSQPSPEEGRPSTLAWRVGRTLLAPVLAAAAVGMHFWLNVPPGGVRHSERDQGARPPGASSVKPRPRLRHEPRDAAALEAAWKRWRGKPFDDEPELPAWARQAEPVINKAVVVARNEAFEGAPEEPRVIVTGTECRTVRCRFLLRSPFSHELDLLQATLERVEFENTPLWRSFTARPIDPPETFGPKSNHYLEIVVALRTDDLSRLKLEVDEPEEAALGAPDDDHEDEDDDEVP